MTRRKTKNTGRELKRDRTARINKLIAAGLISSEADIPPDAIPVDLDRIKSGGWGPPPAYFQNVQFTCTDCGAPQTWKAEDQQWYYETTGAPCYSTAVRCRACRKKEQIRKAEARVSAGHAKPKA